MLYLYSLLNLSASLLPSKGATSGSLHCCLLMENPPSIHIINNRETRDKRRETNVLHHYHCGLPQEKFDICIVGCLLELSVASNLLSVVPMVSSFWHLLFVPYRQYLPHVACFHEPASLWFFEDIVLLDNCCLKFGDLTTMK